MQTPELRKCACAQPFPVKLKFAFQPIVDVGSRSVFAQEALVRGENGESAGSILAQVDNHNLYAFDRTCRIGAVKAASGLMQKRSELLSINTMPNSVYDPETCLRTTIAAAEACDFPVSQIMFEMTEHEAINNFDHFVSIVKAYKSMGFITAVDDFGAGYSGLSLFARVMPDVIKLDRALIDGVGGSAIQKAVVGNLLDLCGKFDIKVIAEGVETETDYRALTALGVTLFQGYYFSRPVLDALADQDIFDVA